MNNEEMQYIETIEKQLELEKMNRMNLQKEYSQTSAFTPTGEKNLVEYQLDLREELDRIYHLLSGHILKYDKDNNEIWAEPQDDRLKIFSEYGVKLIMNIISFYINRNTLLSNFDETTIIWKVRDFGIELSDLFENKYEDLLYYPSPEDLFEKLKPHNKTLDDSYLYEKCLEWSKHEMQSKIRNIPIIVLALIDSVHSTYLRALGGKERGSLRTQMHISQSANQYSQPNLGSNKFSFIKPNTWGKI